MHRTRRVTVAALAAIGLGVALGASDCEGEQPSAQEQLSEQQQDALEALIDAFPVSDPDWSNDRRNIDRWVDKWATAEVAEGKLSYVLLMDMEGDLVGYYILDGLPTAKCRMSTPPYDFIENTGDGDSIPDWQVEAPSLSGTWGGSGECNVYFGFDALTGTYLEWMSGGGINQLVYEEWNGLPEGVEPPMALGDSTFEDVEDLQ